MASSTVDSWEKCWKYCRVATVQNDLAISGPQIGWFHPTNDQYIFEGPSEGLRISHGATAATGGEVDHAPRTCLNFLKQRCPAPVEGISVWADVFMHHMCEANIFLLGLFVPLAQL